MTHPDHLLRSLLTSSLALLCGAGAIGCGGEDPPIEPPPCEAGPGEICSIAGTDIAGFKGDGGPASEAALYLPQDMSVGPDGHLYVLDWNNHRIRRIRSDDGIIETVAGTGMLGDGPVGPALEADFNHPTNITFDGAGKMIIAAWHNSRIKVIDTQSGMLDDACGTGARSYNGDGGPAKDAILDLPASVALDANGDLFIMDQANQVIRKIDSTGAITRVAGQCVVNDCMAGEVPEACPMNNKTVCNLAANAMACTLPCKPAFGGDGGGALELRMAQPFGQQADPAGRIAFDDSGNLYFVDTGNHRVRVIDAGGMVSTVAGTGEAGFSGDGGPATDAQLNRPIDIAIASDGTLYVSDTFNSCVRSIKDGIIQTAAGTCGERGFEGEDGSALAAKLDRPYGIALSPEGHLYIADTYNHRIRFVPR